MVIFHYFSVRECDLQLQYNLEIASRISRAFDNGTKSREIFVHHSYCNNSYWGWDASENNSYHECKIKFSPKTWEWWIRQYYWERFSTAHVRITSGFKGIRKRPETWVSAEQLCLERDVCSVAVVKAISSERVSTRTGKNLNHERICLFALPVCLCLCSKPFVSFSCDSLIVCNYLLLTRRLLEVSEGCDVCQIYFCWPSMPDNRQLFSKHELKQGITILERFCPVSLVQSNKAVEKGIKITCRNTDMGELHPHRFFWGPESCWCFTAHAMLRHKNWLQHRMSPGPGCQSSYRGRQGW